MAEKLNHFFIEAVENHEIENFVTNLNNNINTESLDEIIEKYEGHPSILKIRENVYVENIFIFNDATPISFREVIGQLDPKKAGIENDIPTKILIQSKDKVCGYLSNIYNNSKTYPKNLKLADVTPIHKKAETTLLKNYRPVSLIPIVSKLFERNMYNQIISYINKFLSPYLFGYRKGYSSEQCLTVMLEDWKKALDGKGNAGGNINGFIERF